MKKFLFSHSLLAKNKAALNRSKLTLVSRLLYMSTEVANRAERVKHDFILLKHFSNFTSFFVSFETYIEL